MYYFNKNGSYSSFFNLENINTPDLGDLQTIAPMVILSVVLMTISLILPCFIWFLRNFLRIILKKNYDFFNRSIKWILLICLILFVISVILISLAVQGII